MGSISETKNPSVQHTSQNDLLDDVNVVDDAGLAFDALTSVENPLAPPLVAKLATYFKRHPNQWHDGKNLGLIAGGYAWRTRVSDLRRAPYCMHIENRIRHVKQHGTTWVISEYRYREDLLEGAAEGAATSPAAV